MYTTDRQTDVRRQTASSLNVSPRGRMGGRHNMPRPCKLTFDLESGVRVTCDVGYLLCLSVLD